MKSFTPIIFFYVAVSLSFLGCSTQVQQATQPSSTNDTTAQQAVDVNAGTNSDASQNVPDQALRSPQQIGKKIIADLLARDYMIYRSDEFTGLHYAEAAAGYGALQFASQQGDTALLEKLMQRYWQPPATQQLRQVSHVDASVYGILPLEIYRLKKDGRKLYQGLELADAQWVDLRSDGLTSQARFWIDDIWMVNSLQIQAYRATGNPVYIDRAALFTEVYLRRLQQPNGLFFHGPKAPFYWGRGNGWVASGLAELLTEMPRAHPRYAFIVSRYRTMMAALRQFQAPSGMWKQLIDEPSAWDESSATAMFGYAMNVGVNLKLLAEAGYRKAVDDAWQGLQKHIDQRGRLGEICVGTGQSDQKDYYLKRPRERGDLHGQAPLLWFANAMLPR